MRQFGTEFRFRTKKGAGVLRGSQARGRRSRARLRVITQQLVIEEGTATVLFAPKVGETKPMAPGDPLGLSEGCPRILSRIGYVGLDGLSISQLYAQGAPLPAIGGVSFWFSPDRYIVQLKGRPGPAYEMRRCAWTGSVADGRAAVVFLRGLTSAQLAERGLV